MGAGASVDQATASKHKAFSEEDWKKAGGGGGSLALVRVKIPKADAKAGISFTKTGEIAKGPTLYEEEAEGVTAEQALIVKSVLDNSNNTLNSPRPTSDFEGSKTIKLELFLVVPRLKAVQGGPSESAFAW